MRPNHHLSKAVVRSGLALAMGMLPWLAQGDTSFGGGPQSASLGDSVTSPYEPANSALNVADQAVSGHFVHSLPVELPAGRGPMPQVSVSYDSSAGNGIAGVGWAISGIPAIVRSKGDSGMHFDWSGDWGPDTYRFLPNGWGSHESSDNTIVHSGPFDLPHGVDHAFLKHLQTGRPLLDFAGRSASRSVQCGPVVDTVAYGRTIVGGPCFWEVADGQGNTYYFGGDSSFNASQYPLGSPAAPALWEPSNGVTQFRGIVVFPLYKVVDRAGNYFTISYYNDGVTLYPSRITYNLNDRAGSRSQPFRVDFEYVSRPDTTPMPHHFQVLLNKVRIYGKSQGADSLIRLYQLNHTTSDTGRSLLTSFQTFGIDGDFTGNPPPQPVVTKTFTYSIGAGGLLAPRISDSGYSVVPNCPSSDPAQCQWITFVGDINGDGRDDVVRVYSGSGGAYVEYQCGGPGFNDLTPMKFLENQRTAGESRLFALADINGDGKKDLVALLPTGSGFLTQIAYGDYSGGQNCSLGQWVAQPSDSAAGPQSPNPSDWRVAPIDINGDGYSDIVLYDTANDTLYYKMSSPERGGVLLPVRSYRMVWDWAPCRNPQILAKFMGLVAVDLDGDGRQDAMAVWASAPTPPSGSSDPSNALPGQIITLMAMGVSNVTSHGYQYFEEGLNPPTETCATDGKPWAGRYPYLAVRSGDVNGDGISDVLLSYQGQTIYRQVSNGRDLRYRLGSTTAARNDFKIWLTDIASYPFSSLADGHSNNWEFLIGDINGDGVDDYIQSYDGVGGNFVWYSLNTVNGTLGTLPHPGSTSMPDPDGIGNYPRSLAAIGDFNGDGMKDIARATMGGGRGDHLSWIRGTSNGLSATTSSILLGTQHQGKGDLMQLLVGDFNGDSRDDLILVNNDITASGPHDNLIVLVKSPDPETDTSGLPDVLTTIDNGLGGLTTVRYALSTAMTNPVQNSLPSQCQGANGPIADPVLCGIPNSRPTALVTSIAVDNGVSRDGAHFIAQTNYDYYNSRVFRGRPSRRVDLGFTWIKKTNASTNAATLTYLRQDKPFQGLASAAYAYDRNGAGMGAVSYDYRVRKDYPAPGGETIYNHSTTRCRQENGASMPCIVSTFSWEPNYLFLAEQSTNSTAPGSQPIIEQSDYLKDETNWWIRPQWRTVYRSNGAGTNVILEMSRTAYSAELGREFHPSKIERMLFEDSETATCVSCAPTLSCYPPVAESTGCQYEFNAGRAKWVTVYQNPTFDSVTGEVTYREGIHTPSSHHSQTYTYDPTYSAKLGSVTNELNHVVQFHYDAAGNVGQYIGANGSPELYGYAYDAYGRLATTQAPATSVANLSQISYGPLTSNGYPVTGSTYPSSSSSRTLANYVDGMGQPSLSIDYSSAGVLATLYSRAFVGNALKVRQSYPYLWNGGAGVPSTHIQTTYDDKGRVVRVERVLAAPTYSVEKVLAQYSYSTDGTTLQTLAIDPEGHQTASYVDAWGNLSSTVDGNGQAVSYLYGVGLDKIVEKVLPRSVGPEDNHIFIKYDSWGRKYELTDPASTYTTYAYDDAGNLTTQTSYSDRALLLQTSRQTWTYDALDRVNTEGDALHPLVFYSYDDSTRMGVGRLTHADFGPGQNSSDYYYDARGSIISEAISLAGSGLSGATTYTYAYDNVGRLIQKTFPDAVQSFNYTPDGILSDIIHNTATWAHFSNFDLFKRPLTKQIYNDGSGHYANTITYSYNNDLLLDSERIDGGKGLVASYTYHYDLDNLLTTIDDNRPQKVVSKYNINTDAAASYSYDANHQLRYYWPKVDKAVTKFTYDFVGNLTSDTSSNASITYYVCGYHRCMKSSDRVSGAPQWIATMDSEGKRIEFDDYSVNPAAVYRYSYDYKGRLSSVSKDGVVLEQYGYDHLDRRIKKTQRQADHTTTTTWFVGADWQVRQSSANPNLLAKTLSVGGVANYTYGDLINGQASSNAVYNNQNAPFQGNLLFGPPQGTYIRLQDGLGTPSLMTKWQDGSEASRLWIDAWGAQRRENSVGYDTSYEKFNDKQYEDSSGLLYYGGRYYDPKTRRFITPDDRVINGTPLGHNRFAYALNNPINLADPTGHEPDDGNQHGHTICIAFLCISTSTDDSSDSTGGSNQNSMDPFANPANYPAGRPSSGPNNSHPSYPQAPAYTPPPAAMVRTSGTAAVRAPTLTYFDPPGVVTFVESEAEALQAEEWSKIVPGSVRAPWEYQVKWVLKVLGVVSTLQGGAALLDAAVEGSASTAVAAEELSHVFWSGGRTVEGAARTFANGTDGVVLGDTAAGRAVSEATEGMRRWDLLRPQWLGPSQDFARAASGEVHVFQNGAGISATSIWADEYEILMNNPNVTRVIYHVVMPDGMVIIVP